MSSAIRWRILTLQVILTLVFAAGAAFAFYESNFVSGYVHDQLAAQKITFPAAGTAALTALPAADRAAMDKYAGQLMTTGDQAQTYANHFINVHLSEIGGGKTYAQFPASGLTAAQQATKATLFQGETLRGLLLNAWGWSQVASYVFYGGIVLSLAALATLAALVFEIFAANRRPQSTARQAIAA